MIWRSFWYEEKKVPTRVWPSNYVIYYIQLYNFTIFCQLQLCDRLINKLYIISDSDAMSHSVPSNSRILLSKVIIQVLSFAVSSICPKYKKLGPPQGPPIISQNCLSIESSRVMLHPNHRRPGWVIVMTYYHKVGPKFGLMHLLKGY